MKVLSSEMLMLKLEGPDDCVDGVYLIPHQKIDNYYYQVIASAGEGWDHVSVCLRHRKNKAFIERTCTWAEMCFLKDFFFEKDETVIQYHPAESNYVNNHPWVLHLWRPQRVEIPQPSMIMV